MLTACKPYQYLRLTGLLVAGMFLATACGFGSAAAPTTEKDTLMRQEAPKAEAPREMEAPAHAGEAEKPAEVTKEGYAPLPAPTTTGVTAPLPASEFIDTDEMAAGGVKSDAAIAEPVVRQAERLRAGEVDDNAQWDDYLLYRRQYRDQPVHDRDVSERYVIEVKDAQGIAVLDATVRIFIAGQQERREVYQAHTGANGQVLFHPLALNLPTGQVNSFQVEVQKNDLLEQFTLTRFNAQPSASFSERWTVTLDTRRQANRLNLDVLFLVDSTGSMSDEINKIQSTIFDVSARIDALPVQPNTRYGLVTYRDRGDAYVTRVYDFTPDVRDFSKNLNTMFADGGGDEPESLNEALHAALHKVEWRSQDTVQLIFLIADAPPHLDYDQDYDYAVEMENAAQRGIKIFPIASSGLNEQGEYIFRQLAQYTQGRFIFLTYAGPTNGGAPGDVTTHHVEDYSVENLDDLLVRLVKDELAYQNPQLAGLR